MAPLLFSLTGACKSTANSSETWVLLRCRLGKACKSFATSAEAVAKSSASAKVQVSDGAPLGEKDLWKGTVHMGKSN